MPDSYVPTFDFEHNNDLVLMLMMQMDLSRQIEGRINSLDSLSVQNAYHEAVIAMCQLDSSDPETPSREADNDDSDAQSPLLDLLASGRRPRER